MIDGVPLTLRERVEKFFYEVCEYDNELFIQAIESFAKEVWANGRSAGIQEAASLFDNYGGKSPEDQTYRGGVKDEVGLSHRVMNIIEENILTLTERPADTYSLRTTAERASGKESE